VSDERDFPEGSIGYWKAMHDRLEREGRLPGTATSPPPAGPAPGSRAEPESLDKRAPGRLSPRECIGEARDALNKAYGCGGTRECWPFIMAAADWQRRAIEQLAPREVWCKDDGCQWRQSRHYHADGWVHAPGQMIW
jgi:hypothetical protein